VQRPFQALGPGYDFDLSKVDQEIDINIRGPLHLSLASLPHLNAQPNGVVLMNVSSVLGYLPFSVINPVYNVSAPRKEGSRRQQEIQGRKKQFDDSGIHGRRCGDGLESQ
jgi:short chain dehydrogenase